MHNMRTTIEIPDGLMREVLEISGESKKKDAVRTALEEFVKRRKTERLLGLPGKIEVKDLSKELEEMELNEHQSID